MGFRSSIAKPNSTIQLTMAQTKRITEYGRKGEVERAMELFQQMPNKNQVTWNAMLSVFIGSERLDSALHLFDKMPQKNPTSYTSMITALSRQGSVTKARRVFDSAPLSKRNVFSWTAMVSCYADNGRPRNALNLFKSLYGDFFKSKILPNLHTFSILLKCCLLVRCILSARQVQCLIVKLLDEFGEGSTFVQNCLINVNAKLGNLNDAERVFSRMMWKDLGTWNTMMDAYTHHLVVDKAFGIFSSMKEKDALSWNIIMSGLLESRKGEEALGLFLSMLRSDGNAKPNSSTYTIVLSCCAALTMITFARQIHALTLKNGFYCSNVFVTNSMITVYSSCGSAVELEQVFSEMPKKDVVTWNSVIQGLGQNGCARKTLEIAEKAFSSKDNHNSNTFTAILTSCSHGGLIVEGLDYFKSMGEKYGIEPTLDHYICVVDMLGRAGKLEAAHDLLHHIPLKLNSVAWVTLLNACLIHGNSEIGRIASEQLQILEPDNARSYLALASIYNKTGRICESTLFFDLMREKDLRKETGISWVVDA